MKWFVIISCVYSHTWGGLFYCSFAKEQEVSYGKTTEEACIKWAEEYLSTKYNIHKGQFEWGYKCVQKDDPQPYKPRRLN